MIKPATITAVVMARIGIVGIVSAFLVWLMSGCVVMTRRELQLDETAWRGVGYVEGLSDGAKPWINLFDRVKFQNDLPVATPRETAVPGNQGRIK